MIHYFRADRLATLYLFRPLRRLSGSKAIRLPILMYHSISDVNEERHPYFRTNTHPALFLEQMRILRQLNYKTIRLDCAESLLRMGSDTGEKYVVITFDDGYHDFYRYAFPVLNQFSYSATVFLPTAYIGKTAHRFKDRDCLTWGEVRELKAAGVDFGSHTVSHPKLTDLSLDEVRQEIVSSKQEIEQQLSCRTTSFSYPYAFPETDRTFTRNLGSILEESGYRNGVSTIIGTATPQSHRMFMERLPINSCDDAAFFRAKLEGAYDWLHVVQQTAKMRIPASGCRQAAGLTA